MRSIFTENALFRDKVIQFLIQEIGLSEEDACATIYNIDDTNWDKDEWLRRVEPIFETIDPEPVYMVILQLAEAVMVEAISDDPVSYLNWQSKLKIGDTVKARWIALGKVYTARGRVESTGKKFTVKLTQTIEDYSTGELVDIPKMTYNSPEWGANNGLFPAGESLVDKILSGEDIETVLEGGEE